MQETRNKIIWGMVALFMILFGSIVIIQKRTGLKVVTKTFFSMDTQIYIKLYGTSEKKLEDAIAKVEALYQEYHQLTDRYQEYEGIINPYVILKNTEESDTLIINPKLYFILELSQTWHQKDPLFDITIGDIIDVWKKYREAGTGVPTTEELESANQKKKDLILLGNHTIRNNHVNLDLGSVAKGYTTEEARKLLESLGISTYLINAGGNVVVGEPYQKKDYTIGIEDPTNQRKEMFTVVHGTNLSVVTSGGYERFYEYNGVKYHHIISPITLYPTSYSKSVTVLTKNSAEADILSTILFLLPIDEGMNLVESLEGTEAIWYTADNMVVRSSHMNLYETK